MANAVETREWSVTRAKVDEAVRRIVEHANPLQIIAFGSRARGDHREDSDLDLAVILDVPEGSFTRELMPYSVLTGIYLEVDMVVATQERFDRFRPWLNSVYNYIDQEGIVLYDREHPQRARQDALHVGGGRPARTRVRAA